MSSETDKAGIQQRYDIADGKWRAYAKAVNHDRNSRLELRETAFETYMREVAKHIMKQVQVPKKPSKGLLNRLFDVFR